MLPPHLAAHRSLPALSDAAGTVPIAAAAVPAVDPTTTPAARPPRLILRTDNRFHAAMQVAAVLSLIGLGVLFPTDTVHMIEGLRGLGGPAAQLAILCAGVVIETVLHEAAHGAVFRACGVPVSFGILWRWRLPIAAYCRPHGTIPRRGMVASLIAPQVVVPGALLGVGAVVPTLWQAAVFLSVLNVAGGVGDFAFLWAVVWHPATEGYLDRSDGVYGASGAGDVTQRCTAPDRYEATLP